MDEPGALDSIALPDLRHLELDLSLLLLLGDAAASRVFASLRAYPIRGNFVRPVEVALRTYVGAWNTLQGIPDERPPRKTYWLGTAELEMAMIALHRSVRLAEALKDSPDTRVSNAQLPSAPERDLLRQFRNAIDHTDGVVRNDDAEIFALGLDETRLVIHDEKGRFLVADQVMLGEMVTRLHELAQNLMADPFAIMDRAPP
jgi:hypothetical protein